MIEVVKRISDCDFAVRLYPIRAGNSARIVAEASRIRAPLGWKPRLDAIVAQALAWEDKLATRNRI
ncbi:hypothetical protein [Methylobacterium sp. NEAU K]|uniref:hypothetical protein n=1 Tax=Methylobacterium sp. NEAU K TaxID=3064946 RepID=UPI00273653D6|nr:hypothetical protein [Methylobacterium sp. NEAU K]MDP4002303.1 hypothetical protein [Methylobacterium sp. NEAU K]